MSFVSRIEALIGKTKDIFNYVKIDFNGFQWTWEVRYLYISSSVACPEIVSLHRFD